ncbi:MAG TPA: fimbria/pilus periplasmic chaperone [Sphingomicrobium sp.]
MKRFYAFACVALALPVAPLAAQIQVSQLIVELQPGKHDRQDVDVGNGGTVRAFVEIDPREILNPGSAPESARTDPDPEKLGLLVSPARLVLEPGEHRLIRIATLPAIADRERVYRVTVKPVVGKLSTAQSGLKVLVGYDMLILVRPTVPNPVVSGTRSGNALTIHNNGNVSVELNDGKQCAAANDCAPLPAKRLYVGQSWTQQLKGSAPADYEVDSPGKSERMHF